MRDPDGLGAAAHAALTRPGVLRSHYQPIVDLARGTVAGYEALTRFDGPPAAPPDRWFAAAHAGGFGDALEARALSAALDARSALPPDTFLTVNVGPQALCSAPVQEVLDGQDDLRGVLVEITEQQPVEDYDALVGATAPARARGALLAVDDAGAGFASLQHITRLRPDLVKVDRTLVAGVDHDPSRQAVLEALGAFASRLDAWLLAEGIETAAELEAVIGLGVPLAQGYFLGRPAPAMGDLAPAAAVVCERAARAAGVSAELGDLAESAAVVGEDASDATVAAALLRDEHAAGVIVVDEFHRPVALACRAAGGPVRVPIVSVSQDDRLVDTVRRALARPAAQRFDPLALCEVRGRLIGVLRVERLFDQLANVADRLAGEARDAA